MRKLLAIITSLALIMMMCTACGDSKDEATKAESAYSDVVQSIEDSIDMEYAYNLTYDLAYNEDLGGCCGFRTAGSDYEHKCADYLVKEMKNIGLTDISKEAVTVDKFQFDDASLTIDGTDIDLTPASYAESGTDDDGITAEIVDAGTGFKDDYKDLDVKDKIVLVGVDQHNEAWIDSYIHEAKLHDAAALVTYDVGGYATDSDDIRNIQDVCANDIMPTVSLSKSEATSIQDAIKAGNTQCTLMVKTEIAVDDGTSYNVVGKIKGKSSDQQIIMSAHYDKYFYGFQDDCAAIGTIMSMAKAMIDSGYEPENDIVVVCHGSEEWGASGSQYDWTTGAWEMINNAHPDWAGKTIAMLNFELPAYYVENPDKDGKAQAFVNTIPEFKTLTADVLGSNLTDIFDTGVYEGGVLPEAKDVATMEDGISYRFAGVPYFLNGVYFEGGFTEQKYHTEADNKDTYNEDVMKLNIGMFDSLAVVIDQSPALELNTSAMADWMEETYNTEWADKAKADTDGFNEALATYKTASKALFDKAVSINDEYEKAYKDNDTETMQSLREEGKKLNEVTLQTFATAQDELLAVVSSWDVTTRHDGDIQTLDLLQNIITQIDAGNLYTDDETGAGDIAWNLNGGVEYGYYKFTPAGVDETVQDYFDEDNTFWGTDKTVPFVDTQDATKALIIDEDMDKALTGYETALDEFLPNLKTDVDREVKGLEKINKQLSDAGFTAD